MTGAVEANDELALERAKQVFRFLKAFAERGAPGKRQIRDHHWSQWLRQLPRHPTIVVGEVQLASADDSGVANDGAEERGLLTVRRPRLTKAPEPPDAILAFLQPGWRDPDGSIEVLEARNVVRNGETSTERFDASADRVNAIGTWRTAWMAWAEAERPARAAMKVFEKFYDLKGRIDRESERVELMLGDGRLRWVNADGMTDHPVLLQRVELLFDANVPEFRVVDSDREPELYATVLQGGDAFQPAHVNVLRTELVKQGFHPLSVDGTTGFLKRLVQSLGPNGLFDPGSDRAAGAHPVMSRDPVLFLRDRASGFPAAFDRVLRDLEARGEVPASLRSLVGVEPPVDESRDIREWSPWGEPPDVLLSKPANEEQVHIARALERHRAVLVQGPPGTGKSHTIANLIGHLVANGKRVLVTSHTTKALRVLRGHVVETLKPLCVSVLENDLEGRTQMEEAVRGILSRLTTSTEDALEREVVQLADTRAALNEDLAKITTDLRRAREAEYSAIVLAGESTLPSDAAQWVTENRAGNDWIPGSIDPGAPLPLSSRELTELYETNGEVTPDEEAEIVLGLPEPGAIPTAAHFATLIESVAATEPSELAAFWDHPAREEDETRIHAARALAASMLVDLEQYQRWQKVLIAAGHEGRSDALLWEELAKVVNDANQLLERAKPFFVRYDPQYAADTVPADALRLSRALEEQLRQGGSVGTLALLWHRDWKRFLRGARCNGRPPATVEEMQALHLRAEVDAARVNLRLRWRRQAEPAGLPPCDSFGEDPEPKMWEFVKQFTQLLQWWQDRFSETLAATRATGFKWQAFRAMEVARLAPARAFELDVAILSGPTVRALDFRLGMAQRTAAERLLKELEQALVHFTAPSCRALHSAVVRRDAAAFNSARERLVRLIDRTGVVARRAALQDRLLAAAPAWVNALRERLPGHEGIDLPGDPGLAWKWAQLHQEVQRRASLNEVALTQRLRQRREELRAATANLIDRRAWLGQIRRIDLRARQALQGWAQTQRRIGRGTGKHAPMLQAQARQLLAQARDAVPVWIMPLSRVAESFDPTKGKFDVVIVDEASQSDIMGLLAWYLGERVAIVGDHEQVSPLAVGQDLATATQLIAEHLTGVPNSHLYDGRLSIYDLARQSFGGTIALREHFRCVPDIIDFSNYLSYNGEIRPLRDPARVRRPHVVPYRVSGTPNQDRDKRNRSEAQAVVAIMKALCESPDNSDRTMGAISLVGDEQAGLIQELALEVLGATELDRRRFASGNPAQFQGDERDIMLLSMVDVPSGGRLAIRQDERFKQRYNVATSRARDQLWLVYSLDPAHDLQAGDLRRRLIEHVLDPGAKRLEIQHKQARAESPFERSVLQRLVSAGYRVDPQVWVGQYRIDMVVSDDHAQVALECDGDRWHGVEQIPLDMARQAILERAGWRFVRIRGTRYYRSPDDTMRWVFEELARLGVRPAHAAVSTQSSTRTDEVRHAVVRRAWEIMREHGWISAELPLGTEPSGSPD